MSTQTDEQIMTRDLRETLKAIVKNEIEDLPKTLEKLEPKDRMTILCRLMPYVFPKVQHVNSKEGEPFQMEW